MVHEDGEEQRMVGIPMVINERPLYFWDNEDPATQVYFLENIDTDYFRFLAQIHQSQLDGENGPRAAVSLRIAYSHTLETLFAFIGAALQAPDCPAGWLLKYQNRELNDLVRKISARKPIYNRMKLRRPGWKEGSNTILPKQADDGEKDELRSASARLWKSLARDLVDEVFGAEYNSFKHGFRVRSGEWQLSIGLEEVPGTPAPPDRMVQMAFSRFGSSFLRPSPLDKKK